jgi:hypothetical protein
VALLLLWMQAPVSEVILPVWWEFAKAIALSLILAGITYIIRRLKRLDYLDTIVVGPDGTNGLRGEVKKHAERLDLIDDRNLAIDAVAKAARAQYGGEERRHEARRAEDVLADIIAREVEKKLAERKL